MSTLPVNPPTAAESAPHCPNSSAESKGNGPAVYDSLTLLRGHKEAWIQHQGSVYRLQATRQGKLILTK